MNVLIGTANVIVRRLQIDNPVSGNTKAVQWPYSQGSPLHLYSLLPPMHLQAVEVEKTRSVFCGLHVTESSVSSSYEVERRLIQQCGTP